MVDILIDTNILVYIFGGHPTYLNFSRTLIEKTPGISIVTYIEMLTGARDDAEEIKMRKFLAYFEVLPLDITIADEIARWMRQKKRKSLRDPRFGDTVIAKTALLHNIPVVTNNPKDFAIFKGLEIMVPENPVRPPPLSLEFLLKQ